MLAIQKPHDVRLKGTCLGNPALDLGSNDQGWWFWFGKDEPKASIQASRKDLVRGASAGWPGSVGPEVLVWIMGMKEYDPAVSVEVIPVQDTIEFVEKATSPQGKPIRRVTVFQRDQMTLPQSQIKGYRIEDAEKKELFRVDVREVSIDKLSGAIVPMRLDLFWPAEKVKVVVRMDNPEVGIPLKPERAIQLFTPPPLITGPREKP